MGVCIFCGWQGKLTKDHGLASWLEGYIPGEGRFEHLAVSTASPQREWTSAELDFKVGRICKACNSGWMSDLETAVAPVVARMINATGPILIKPSEQTILRFWLAKTTLVLDLMHGTRNFADDWYTELYAAQRPRARLRISLACSGARGNHVFAYQGRLIRGPEVGGRDGDDVYLGYFRLGKLAAQLSFVAQRPSDWRFDKLPLKDRFHELEAGASKAHVWPRPPKQPLCLSHEDFQALLVAQPRRR